MLYQHYFPPIYNYLYRMVGNAEDAEDLTMETFLRVWRRLPRLPDERHFRSWLYAIARHTALDYIRKRKRPPLAGSLDREGSDETVAQFEDRLEDQELVRLALEQVSPTQRACLILEIKGFSLAEIAKSVGMSERSVRFYISRGREQLRKAYDQLRGP